MTKNIPFSLAYRIVRICSEQETRDKRLEELKQLLLDRGYKKNIINAAIIKAKAIPRNKALEKTISNSNTDVTRRRPVFAVHYDPRLPALPHIIKKHWRTMVGGDPHLKEVFPLPPLVAYKRPKNIRDKIIRSKIPTKNQTRPIRVIPGMKKCNNCPICPYVKEGKRVKSSATNFSVEINRKVNCQSKNVVYCITCDRCNVQYIGESERKLQEKFTEHKGYALNAKLSKATGEHYSQKGHKVSDMQVTILEKIFSSDPAFRKEREKYYIMKMNCKYKGLNRIT